MNPRSHGTAEEAFLQITVLPHVNVFFFFLLLLSKPASLLATAIQ